MITSEVQDFATRSVLCWLATASSDGQPNVSPKEIFAVFDESHIVIANIASPGSVKNIASNPQVCVSFIEVFVQKGYKVFGLAEVVKSADCNFADWVRPLQIHAGERFPIHSVIVVRASRIEQILAPSYRLYPGETTEQTQVASAMRTYGVRPLK